MFNEHNYKHLYKENPLLRAKASVSDNPFPIENGCVLILSKPYEDGLKRVFLGIINRVRGEQKVNFEKTFYIVKEYPGGIIWPDKAGDIRHALNMKSTGLELNEKKTPLWWISCNLPKNQFFRNHQSEIKEILQRNDIFTVKSERKLPYD